jgi:hypothetical protein
MYKAQHGHVPGYEKRREALAQSNRQQPRQRCGESFMNQIDLYENSGQLHLHREGDTLIYEPRRRVPVLAGSKTMPLQHRPA